MDAKDQRFAEEVLRRALAHAKSIFDDGLRGSLSSTVLFESEIRAATKRAARLEQSVIDSYVSYFQSMDATSAYQEHDASIFLEVDLFRTKWPDLDGEDLRSRIAILEAQSAEQSVRINNLTDALNTVINALNRLDTEQNKL
jgi:hypothetical protein